jgi:alpha-glucosidase
LVHGVPRAELDTTLALSPTGLPPHRATGGTRDDGPVTDRGDATTEAAPPWWRTAVIYEIYVRSFSDADGDGVGDLAGITQRLPALRDLGVDAIWLTPFYRSPQADAGYDVEDHRDVDPVFGTLGDFDHLIAAAQELGLRVLVDIVPNHTSEAHPWFQAALRGEPGGPERARYLFRDGRGDDGMEPPNDWESVFGGSAWTRIDEPDGRPGQWYLHLFASQQPDLDWTNDEVRAEFESILQFWLDRGIDGFRIDVALGLMKQAGLPDLAGRFPGRGFARAGHPHWDRDEVHDIYRAWRRVIDRVPGEQAFVAEAYLPDTDRLARYVRPDELHTAFNFNLLLATWDADELRLAIDGTIRSMATVGAPPTWVLSNHDRPRHATRYGGGEVGTERARAAVLLLLALPGSAYLYQGEELGLPEVTDLPASARQDPIFFRTGGKEAGRDGCRVPLPWSGDAPSFGFSPSGASWLPQPADWGDYSRERQRADEASMLALYRQALTFRRRLALGEQALHWLDAPGDALAFRRGDGFGCVVNVGDEAIDPPEGLPSGTRLLSSRPLADDRIPGRVAVWYGDTGQLAG